MVETENLESTIQNVIKTFNLNVSKDYIDDPKYSEIAKSYLQPGEQIIFATKQSHMTKLMAPLLLMLTNKKVIILKPSFSKLHTNTNIFGATKTRYIPYNAIKNIDLETSVLHSCLTIKAVGMEEVVVEGLNHVDAKLTSQIVENIVESYG